MTSPLPRLMVMLTRPIMEREDSLLPPLHTPRVMLAVPGNRGRARPRLSLKCSSVLWISESTRLIVMLLGRLISGSATSLLELPCNHTLGSQDFLKRCSFLTFGRLNVLFSLERLSTEEMTGPV